MTQVYPSISAAPQLQEKNQFSHIAQCCLLMLTAFAVVGSTIYDLMTFLFLLYTA